MAIATAMFWWGRHQFVHIPAGGMKFFRELFSAEGLWALAKLIPLYLFIALFWALYDQTGSSWVLQAENMDLHFAGITWLESQVQAINPILILVYIPLFTFVIYPWIHRFFPLTPLRKIGIGLFLVAASFALIGLIQSWIDAGEKPSIGWQLVAYLIITAAEVMISIVGLEFSYTQSPKNMKSLVMAFYLLAVFVGNLFTAEINRFIQIPSASRLQWEQVQAQQPAALLRDARNVVLPGHDQQTGTKDDLIVRLSQGQVKSIDFSSEVAAAFDKAAKRVIERAQKLGHRWPEEKEFPEGQLGVDPWGNPIRYNICSQSECRLISAGPDQVNATPWDLGVLVRVNPAEESVVAATSSWWDRLHPAQTWLHRRAQEMGVELAGEESTGYTVSRFSGGQTKWEGQAYYWFFTLLMLVASILYIPFAWMYRVKKMTT